VLALLVGLVFPLGDPSFIDSLELLFDVFFFDFLNSYVFALDGEVIGDICLNLLILLDLRLMYTVFILCYLIA